MKNQDGHVQVDLLALPLFIDIWELSGHVRHKPDLAGPRKVTQQSICIATSLLKIGFATVSLQNMFECFYHSNCYAEKKKSEGWIFLLSTQFSPQYILCPCQNVFSTFLAVS